MSTDSVIIFDLIVVAFTAWVLLHLSGKSLYHPGFMYWLFHVAVVTSRLWLWHSGIWTQGQLLPLTDLDLAKAAVASDIGLLFFAIGMIVGSLGSILQIKCWCGRSVQESGADDDAVLRCDWSLRYREMGSIGRSASNGGDLAFSTGHNDVASSGLRTAA
jgi:hypothetical protein